jgi:hypothetical protein
MIMAAAVGLSTLGMAWHGMAYGVRHPVVPASCRLDAPTIIICANALLFPSVRFYAGYYPWPVLHLSVG